MGRERKEQASPYAEAKAAATAIPSSQASGSPDKGGSKQTGAKGGATTSGSTSSGTAVRVSGGTQQRTPSKNDLQTKQQNAWNKGQPAKITDPFSQGGVQLVEGEETGPSWMNIEGDAPKEVREKVQADNDARANFYLNQAAESLASWNGSNPEAYKQALSYASYYKTWDNNKDRQAQWDDIYNKSHEYLTREEQFGLENVNGFDNYLKSGQTNSETTQKYLDGVNSRLNSATGEKDQMFWKQQKENLEKALEVDQKNEKPGFFQRLFGGGKDKEKPTDEERAQEQADGMAHYAYLANPTNPELQAQEEAYQEKYGEDLDPVSQLLDTVQEKTERPERYTPGSDEDAARWKDIEAKAAEEAAKGPSTDVDPLLGDVDLMESKGENQKLLELRDQREAAKEAYNKAYNADLDASGYVTDPNDPEYQKVLDARTEAADALRELNIALGYEAFADMAPEESSRAGVEGWLGNRYGSMGAAIGTGLEWFDAASDAMVKAEYDAEHGEGAWDKAVAENPDLENYLDLGQVGNDIYTNSAEVMEEADKDWAAHLYDKSEAGQWIANEARTIGDVTLDMIDNFILPGSGRVRMGLSAGGEGAVTQGARDANDIDSRAAKMVLDGGAAYLSEYLMGGAELAYDKSILGKFLDSKVWAKATSPVLRSIGRRAASGMSEGLEEVLESGLSYAGDRILALSPEEQFAFDQAGQEFVAALFVGAIFNGSYNGEDIDVEKAKRYVDAAIEARLQDLGPEETVNLAREAAKEDAVVKGMTDKERAEAAAEDYQGEQTALNQAQQTQAKAQQNQQNQNLAAGQEAALEGQNTNPTVAPAQTSADIAAGQQAALEGQDVNPTAAPTQTSADIAQSQTAALEGQDTNPQSAPTQTSADIAASQTAALQGQETNAKPAPAQTLEERMETGDVSEEEYMELLGTEEGREELAEALGTKSTSPEDVANGLTVYLYLQQQGYLNPQGENQTGTSPDEVSMLLGEESTPKYGQDGFVNPMGEDIDEDENFQTEEEMGEDEDRPSLDELRAEMAEQEQAQNQNQEQNEVGLLLGTEPEQQNATQTNPAPENINTQAEQTNVTEGVFNAQEGTENQGAVNTNANPNENAGTNANPNENAENNPPKKSPPSRKEKISQYFLNTLTESGRAKGLDPITYNPTSEAESLANAAMRLANDKQAVLDSLMNSAAWNGEMVDAAWILENEFYKEFVKTGNRKNLDAWKQIETYKISETAKGLQAVAKQSRPGAAGVLEASANLLNDLIAEIENSPDPNSKANREKRDAIRKADKNINDACRRMAEIENAIDEMVNGGISESEAKTSVKDAYLDLAVKINKERGRSFFLDDSNQSKFRRMLGEQDMDFIQRFVACQAAGIAEDVNYKGKQDLGKQLNTFQKLAQLTGTGTWARNALGNGSFGLIDILANNNPVTLLADQLASAATGKRSTGFERGILERGNLAAFKKNWRRACLEIAANIDLAENADTTKYDQKRVATFDPNGNLFERALSRWEQLNGYMLNASDQAFKGGIENSSEAAIRRANERRGNKVSDSEIQETADQVSEYRTFQNDGIASGIANDIRDTFNRAGIGGEGETHKGGFGIGTALSPYTKVPTNIGVKALEYSPAGAVKGIAELIKVMTDENATMAQQNKAVTDFGRGITGTGLIAVLAMLMKQAPFFKDWENEEDKDVKAQNKSEGKSGMQFNLSMIGRFLDGDKSPTWENDDRTIDISSIEPLNQLITAASLMAEGDDFSTAVLQSAKENFMELPSVSMLKNIEDTIRYTDTPDDLKQTLINTGASTAGNVASGFIPAPVRHATTVTDEYARDTSGNNPVERAWNQIKASVPGLRKTLPVKTDSFGNEVEAGDAATRIINTYSGVKSTQVNQSDVSRELERIRDETGESLMPSRNAPSTVKFGNEKAKLSADERRGWKNEAGQDYEDGVDLLLRNSVYQNADSNTQAELLSYIKEFTDSGVKADYADDNGYEYNDPFESARDMDNPFSYLTTSKQFSIAEKDNNWDVVDTLIEPLKNMTEADRAKSRDRQGDSTMWSYYDFLTPNAEGYAASGAQAVHDYKEASKAGAKSRGVKTPSGIDKMSAIKQGLKDGTLSDADADAFFSKQQSDGDWDLSKGRYAIYAAARSAGASPLEAIRAIEKADTNNSGSLDQWGYTQKALYEVSNAIKKGKYDMGEFDRIYNAGKKKK